MQTLEKTIVLETKQEIKADAKTPQRLQKEYMQSH
jgi:hypothetical protein